MKPTYSRILIFVAVLSHCSISQAQTASGTLKGRITSSLGDPVTNANVLIRELAKGDVSTASGEFSIGDIPPGDYTLVVTSLGFERSIHHVAIKENEMLRIEITLTEKALESPVVVITGTRSEKTITNVPIPTSVLTDRQIRAQSAFKLNDLLAEQQGMFINFNQWGTGIQVEGLDPAYTLILIDGQPVVGRTAGTLELTRLSLGNIQRVEVVRGPSSSLYGSEALAAVVNLITKQPTAPLDFTIRTRYGTNNTLDVNGQVETRQGNLGTSIFVERNSSDGYDLTPQTESKTMPRSTNYSVNPKLTYDMSHQTKLAVSARYVTQSLSNIASVLVGTSNVNFDDRSKLLDWSVAPSVTHRFSSALKFEGKVYAAHYNTESKLTYQTDGSTFDQSTFNQTYSKVEGQLDASMSSSFLTTLGGGSVYETVFADRISGDERSASSSFAFGQQEWIPVEELDFIASFRFDGHAEYAARFSPKVSALVKPWDWMSVRASVGSGFKAPTFQQLYLDFTNPQVGYSVFGSAGVKEAFQRLQQTGQIQSVLTDPNSLERIRPENSLAYNAGLELSLFDELNVRMNFFRNDLKDLIEAAPIAMKNNGQAVYTYFNINKVFTQGFDGELTMKPVQGLSISLSYQYLEAKDRTVLEDVRAGKIFKIGSTGRARPVQEVEYGGLFNRSVHSGTVKLLYDNEEAGLTASIRGILRSRYGFADNNGNAILDDDSEYAPGYALWNVTCSQRILDFLTLQAGVENVFGVTNRDYTPFLPGRIAFAGAAINF